MNRQEYKKMRSRKKWTKTIVITFVSIITLIAVTLLSLRIYAQVAGAPSLNVQTASIFYDQNGEQIGDYYSNERRYWTSLDNISPHVINATIAVEDQNFYKHNGFDFIRIGGAVVRNIQAGSKVQGASTLTQQYARNLYLSHEKTWSRKFNEALYAYRLEVFYSKDELLEGYLNTVYYGNGMYGIEAASKYYFAKSAKDLTLAEAAMLSGIPKGPSIYAPNANTEKAVNRQQLILRLMAEQGKITEEEKQAAQAEQLVYKSDEWAASKSIAPYFLDTVWAEATAILKEQGLSISQNGWNITTTLNQTHQKAAEQSFKNNMPNTSIQGAFVSMEPHTGYVTALVGGRSYTESPLNRVTKTTRQPGSAIKPFLYAAALEEGYGPLTFKDVSKTTFKYDGKEYTPKNSNRKYANHDLSMAQALAVSDNVYAVSTLVDIGYDRFRNMLKRFELSYSTHDVPATALGTKENSLFDLTAAYNVLASNGQNVQPTTILKIVDAKGKTVYEHSASTSKQVITEKDAFLLTDMMTGMFEDVYSDYSPATGVSIQSIMSRQYAGKSGTTNTDQWMFGYTPSLTAGIWNGYDNSQEISTSSEGNATKRVWIGFMERALTGTPNETFEAPKGVEKVNVEITSGHKANSYCEGPTTELYVDAKDVPTGSCTYNFFKDNTWDKFIDNLPFSNWFR